MNTDIRVNIGLVDHLKYKRLKRALGESPMEYLITFWACIAKYQPMGELIGWTPEEIEDAAGYNGKAGRLFDALITTCFLDQIPGGYYPHDWHDHQSWVIGAKERSEKAKKAINVRWERKRNNSPDTPPDTPSNTGSDTPSNTHGNTPSPSPLPNQNLNTEEDIRACEKMAMSEIQNLHVKYLGKIPHSQPVASVLQDICREYPPGRIRIAFKSVVNADRPNLKWITTYLDNPNNWRKDNGSGSSSGTEKAGRKKGIIEANGAGTDFLS